MTIFYHKPNCKVKFFNAIFHSMNTTIQYPYYSCFENIIDFETELTEENYKVFEGRNLSEPILVDNVTVSGRMNGEDKVMDFPNCAVSILEIECWKDGEIPMTRMKMRIVRKRK